jgi:hypothetical protein
VHIQDWRNGTNFRQESGCYLRSTNWRSPGKKTEEVIGALRDEITAEFQDNRNLAKLSADQRRLSLVFTGFVDGNLVMYLISNFEDHKSIFALVGDEFVLTKIRATDGTGSWSGVFGAQSAVGTSDKAELNLLISSGKNVLAAKGKCHAMIARAGPRSGGLVGPHILTATLPRGGHASSWYSAEDADETIRTIDQFHALAGGGYGMAIRDIQISAPGLTSQRPARRGRRGKHQP